MRGVIFTEVLDKLASMAIGALVTYVITEIRARKKMNEALKEGLQALLRDRIIQAYNHYVKEKKWIPIYAKESLVASYESYEALGANGVIDDLMAEINALPNYKEDVTDDKEVD